MPTLIQLIVERGPDAVNALPKGIRKSEEAVAETIENNVRKLIINESPVDPAYYEKMSKLLDALIELRRKGAISYKEYLAKIAALTKETANPRGGQGGYPASLDTAANPIRRTTVPVTARNGQRRKPLFPWATLPAAGA